jgi:monofunctional glycosyltransferase
MEAAMVVRVKLTRIAKILAAIIATFIVATLVYGGSGYIDARADAAELSARANTLIANGRGAEGLGAGRIDQLLLVEDPGFGGHSGVDLSTAGAGLTTLSQSVAKRAGFDNFKPGVMKIRLMGYAIGLEQRLTKAQIIALWLDMVGMGRGPDGWMTGFYRASDEIYGRPPSELTNSEFLSLIAVPIAPRNFDLQQGNAALTERVSRIERLVEGQCRPAGLNDVWLDGCALP